MAISSLIRFDCQHGFSLKDERENTTFQELLAFMRNNHRVLLSVQRATLVYFEVETFETVNLWLCRLRSETKIFQYVAWKRVAPHIELKATTSFDFLDNVEIYKTTR